MLNYRMVPNYLTSTLSYRADVIQNSISINSIIPEIHLRLPSIDAVTISTVVDALRNTVTEMVGRGESPSIDGFVRFYPSIPGSFLSSEDQASVNQVRINATVSSALESQAKSDLSLSKQPYFERVPVISSIMDASGRMNYLGSIITFEGDGLDFDKTDTAQGVFVSNTSTGVSYGMLVYASVTNGKIIGLNDFVVSAIADGKNEFLSEVRVRYTPKGSLRTGQYSVPTRYLRGILSTDGSFDNDQIFNIYEGQSLSSGGHLTGVNFASANDEGEFYDFSISISTGLSGDIRPDSTLDFTFLASDGQSKTHTVQCYDQSGNQINSYEFEGLSISDNDGSNTISGISITFDDVADFFGRLNFVYRGMITEVIRFSYTAIP